MEREITYSGDDAEMYNLGMQIKINRIEMRRRKREAQNLGK